MKNNFLIFIVLIVSGLLHFSTLKPGHDWGDDFALYLLQTKSLEKNQVHELHFQMQQLSLVSSKPVSPELAPWGFPIILLPAYCISDNIKFLQYYNLLFFFGFLILYFVFVRNKTSFVPALLLTAVIAFSPYFFDFKNHLLAEFPFLFFSFLSLILAAKFNNNTPVNFSQIILLIVVFSFTFLIKWQGILLGMAFFLSQLISIKKNSSCAYSCLFIIPVAFTLFFCTSFWLPFGKNYDFLDFQHLIYRVFENLKYYFFASYSFFTVRFSAWLLIPVIPFFFIGLWNRFIKDIFPAIYLLLYMALLLAISYQQGFRYMMPVFPLFLYFSLQGMLSFSFKQRIRFHPAYLFFLLIISVFLVKNSIEFKRYKTAEHSIVDGPYTNESKELFQKIFLCKTDTIPVVFHKPRLIMYFTGCRAAFIEKPQMLKSYQNCYLILDKKLQPEWMNFIRQNPEMLFLVWENNRFVVYKK